MQPSTLVGRSIKSVGRVNRAGEVHARITFDDNSTLLARMDDVMITLASKPVGKETQCGTDTRSVTGVAS